MSDEDTGTNIPAKKSEDKLRGVVENIADKLGKGITDLTTLDVTTYIGDPVKVNVADALGKDLDFSTLQDVYVAGYTRIDVDGDIIEILNGDPKTGSLTLSKQVLDIHKKNVDNAVDNWNTFFRNLLTITATIWALADPNPDRVKIIEALREKIEPVKSSANQNDK